MAPSPEVMACAHHLIRELKLNHDGVTQLIQMLEEGAIVVGSEDPETPQETSHATEGSNTKPLIPPLLSPTLPPIVMEEQAKFEEPQAEPALLDDRDEATDDSDESDGDVDPPLLFDDLVELLSTPSDAMPRGLINDLVVINEYTNEEMDLIILQLAARYWYYDIQNLSRNFDCWLEVFSMTRQEHRLRAASLPSLENLGLIASTANYDVCSFVKTIPHAPLPPSSQGHKELEAKYYPGGIDDAIVGFAKHKKLLQKSMSELNERVKELLLPQNQEMLKSCALADELLDLIAGLEPRIHEATLAMSKWFLETRATLRQAQLPGAQFGLKYGEDFTFDYDTLTIHENLPMRQMPDGTRAPIVQTDESEDRENYSDNWAQAIVSHNRRVDPENYPVRMLPLRPGSAWLDWLRNREWTDYNFSFNTHNSDKGAFMGDELKDRQEHEDRLGPRKGPIEIHLPGPILGVVHHFTVYLRRFGMVQLQRNNIPVIPVSDAEFEARAKRLSEATGEPYWRVRQFDHSEHQIDLELTDNPMLKHRPIFDGAGNLRYDYMNSILWELRTRHIPLEYRSEMRMMVLKTTDNDGDHWRPVRRCV
ncbi:hypothetical protein F5Y18DRAFT_438067 [Xylariaceae sp. FL1019]|nr:hypothetical protein F5Y18DRAFT_438067 [Xylariaceae sp. FL1019]